MKRRIGWIDAAKGLCMLSIIIGHLPIPYLKFVYIYHLPVFFLLSGYTMKVRSVDADFLRQKFARLVHPYFVTCFFVMCMTVVNSVLVTRKLTVVDFTGVLGASVRSAFFASGALTKLGGSEFPMIGAIWFLPAMFFAVTVSSLLLSRLKAPKHVFAVALPVALLSAVSARYFWLPFSLQAGLFAVPFVLLGFYAKERGVLEQKRVSWIILSGLLFLAGCFTEYGTKFWLVSDTVKDFVVTPVIALAGSFFVIKLLQIFDRFKVTRALCAPLRLCGFFSLQILCVHLFEMNTLSAYVTKALTLAGLENRQLFRFPLRLVLIAVLVALVVLAKKGIRLLRERAVAKEMPVSKRDRRLDVLRAIMIIAMVAGYYPIDPTFRAIVFSVHMPAFLFVSGYFHRPVTRAELPRQLWHHVKSLRWYLIFAVLYLLHDPSMAALQTVLLGVSRTDKLLPDAVSVGPVYFFLLLFVLKLVYLLVEAFVPKEAVRNLVFGVLICGGVLLGHSGLYLPWSADSALFCLAFYLVGHYVRKYELLRFLADRPYLYFVLTPVWFYMIRNGSLELVTRNYGDAFGFAVLGSVCGILTVWLLSDYLVRHLPRPLRFAVCSVGEATPYILILHTLYNVPYNNFCEQTLGLTRQNLFFYIATIILQISTGTAVFLVIRLLKKTIPFPRKDQTAKAAPAA